MEWSHSPFQFRELFIVDIPVVVFKTFRVEDVPPLPKVSCPECQRNSGVVLDVTTGDVRRVCTLAVVSAPDPPVPSIGSRVGHFANCPHCMGGIRPRCPSLVKAPSHGCFAFISLGLLAVETRFSVHPFSIGPRAPVLEGADSVLDTPSARHHRCVCCPFFYHLHDDPLAVAFSSFSSWGPSGDHLVASWQEALTPPHILSWMEV